MRTCAVVHVCVCCVRASSTFVRKFLCVLECDCLTLELCHRLAQVRKVGIVMNGVTSRRRDGHSAAPPLPLVGVAIQMSKGGVSKMTVSLTARRDRPDGHQPAPAALAGATPSTATLHRRHTPPAEHLQHPQGTGTRAGMLDTTPLNHRCSATGGDQITCERVWPNRWQCRAMSRAVAQVPNIMIRAAA